MRAERRVRAMAWSLETIPHQVRSAAMDRIGRDRFLVVEELGELEDRRRSLVGLLQVGIHPRLAAVAGGHDAAQADDEEAAAISAAAKRTMLALRISVPPPVA
jgi:hypothetical protein